MEKVNLDIDYKDTEATLRQHAYKLNDEKKPIVNADDMAKAREKYAASKKKEKERSL